MFILDDNDTCERARKKALKVNPAIEVIELGLYHVQGSQGNWYHVACKRDPVTGEKKISCECVTTEGRACYHGLRAAYVHIELMREHQRERSARS